MSLWVVTKEYDVANLKTNIVSVEPYEQFVLVNGYRQSKTANTDTIEAIDALDAWKKAREMFSERY